MRERGHEKLITTLSQVMEKELRSEMGYWPDAKREVRAMFMERDGNLDRLQDLTRAMAFALSRSDRIKIILRRLT